MPDSGTDVRDGPPHREHEEHGRYGGDAQTHRDGEGERQAGAWQQADEGPPQLGTSPVEVPPAQDLFLGVRPLQGGPSSSELQESPFDPSVSYWSLSMGRNSDVGDDKPGHPSCPFPRSLFSHGRW